MEIIKTDEQLIAAAARNGVTLNETEAATLLHVFADDYEKIAMDDQYDFFMSGDGYERSTNLNEIVSLAMEVNSERLMEDLPDCQHVYGLRLIEHLLNGLMEKVKVIVKPKIRAYNVRVVANYAKTIQVEAASWAEATHKANVLLMTGEVTFGAEDFIYHSAINAVPVEEGIANEP